MPGTRLWSLKVSCCAPRRGEPARNPARPQSALRRDTDCRQRSSSFPISLLVYDRRATVGASERQLQAELHDPRIAAARQRTGDRPKTTTGHRGVRIREVHLIEDVEHLRPELQPGALRNPDVLEETHIEVVQFRAVEHVPAEVAERPDVVNGECGRAKPYTLVDPRRRCRACASQLRPVVTQPRQGVVASALDIERRSGLVLPE